MMMGTENLQNISTEELLRMPPFAHYQKAKQGDYNALIPTDRFLNPLEGIKVVDVQKMGFVKEKDAPLDVYNLHLQATRRVHSLRWHQDHVRCHDWEFGRCNAEYPILILGDFAIPRRKSRNTFQHQQISPIDIGTLRNTNESLVRLKSLRRRD